MDANTIDLTRLSQRQVAWLLGKSPAWLRANAHCFPRNRDGTYCGRSVIATLREIEPAPPNINAMPVLALLELHRTCQRRIDALLQEIHRMG